MPRSIRSLRVCAATCLFLLSLAATARAESLTLAWDHNPEPDVTGYVLLVGTASGQYTHSIDVGNVTQWTLIDAAAGQTYYFAVQAYDASGERSDPSAEISGIAESAPTPPALLSAPRMSVDLPANNASVTGNFLIAGWAADLGSTNDAGVDAVHVWAYPEPGSGRPAMFLGAATTGHQRADVSAAFSSPSAAASGFALDVINLAPGVYDLVVFAHSRIAGEFNNASVVRVTVKGAESRPMMFVDAPAASGVVGTTFHLGGWALDLGSARGSGITTVHVWAYPASGQAPVFVGVATVGVSRPDVGAAFGARFSSAGYHMTGSLAPGSYTLAVFAFSSVANQFNNATAVPVTVR